MTRGGGGQGGPASWPQKPAPPPWPAEANYANGARAAAPGRTEGLAGGAPFGGGANGSGVSAGGGGGRRYGGGSSGAPSPPTEAFRGAGGGGAHGLRKRPGAESSVVGVGGVWGFECGGGGRVTEFGWVE